MPTTISVAGFPIDATFRELKNVLRLFPGFEAASPNLRQGKPPTVFVKFQSGEAAADAIIYVQTLCFDEDNDPSRMLKAEFAHKEMSTRTEQQPVQHVRGDSWPQDGGPLKRARMTVEAPPWRAPIQAPIQWSQAGAPSGCDTLACKLEGANDSTTLCFFERLNGFVASKLNGSGHNCFVKFADTACAQQALRAATSKGLTVDFAKRNLESWPAQEWQAQEPWLPAYPAGPFTSASPWAGGIRTLACKMEGRHDETPYRSFFEGLTGFEALKLNAQGSNCFVKFVDSRWAEQGLVQAKQAGYTIEYAKRDLEEDIQQFHQPVAPPLAVRTLAPAAYPGRAGAASSTLACKVEGQSEDEVRSYFEGLPGFEALKLNANGLNCFVKFQDGDSAHHAMGLARGAGYTLDFAKRELA